nr:LEF-3 [Darna trima granulovirus]
MSKRPIDNSDMTTTLKVSIKETVQTVLMKRIFQKSTNSVDNVCYKLDCQLINTKKKNLINVLNKEDYDNIKLHHTYKFTIKNDGLNSRWYLVKYQLLNNVEINLVSSLELSMFENESKIKVNYFVQGVYDCINTCVKMFGLIKLNGEYKQCDMVVQLDKTSCFNFTPEDSELNRSIKCLTTIHKELLNKWSVFTVSCRKYNIYYSMVVIDDTTIEKSDLQDTEFYLTNNISYGNNKIFMYKQIESVSKCINTKYNNNLMFKEKSDNRMVIELKLKQDNTPIYTIKDNNKDDDSNRTIDLEEQEKSNEVATLSRANSVSHDEFINDDNLTITGSKFNVKDENIDDLMDELLTINFNIENGTDYFCVYNYKLNDIKNLINIVAINSVETDIVKSVMSS